MPSANKVQGAGKSPIKRAEPSKIHTSFLANSLTDRIEGMNTLLNIKPDKDMKAFFAKLRITFLGLGGSGLDVSDEVLVPFVLAKLAIDRQDLFTALELDGVKPEEIAYEEVATFCIEYDERMKKMESKGMHEALMGSGARGKEQP